LPLLPAQSDPPLANDALGVSQKYLLAVEGWEQLTPPHVAVTVTGGTVGVKLGQLRAWLRGEVWKGSGPRSGRLVAPAQPRGRAELCGKVICLTREEVFAAARRGLEEGGDAANRYRDWYVPVDRRPVAAKWLVSQMSGLPTSAFDASAARRVLLALGVDVERRERLGCEASAPLGLPGQDRRPS
jgi:hypothetical protein